MDKYENHIKLIFILSETLKGKTLFLSYGKVLCQWCFTNFTQNDTISMEEKNIRAELEKSTYFNTRSKKFHIC
ncbi:uncharacterised protein [Saccharolobus solfataricus]|uniref:Uncharacterized protein n=1 Tax=Saccharolobus solfataricus TaxID=2287 RepID=A0A157T155_SACSO|nr:uncharacterised protein [Saccharolobus solfataricus]